jgi:MFS family permease
VYFATIERDILAGPPKRLWIMGYIFGCRVAAEMARRLEARRVAVEFVGLLAGMTAKVQASRSRRRGRPTRPALRQRIAGYRGLKDFLAGRVTVRLAHSRAKSLVRFVAAALVKACFSHAAAETIMVARKRSAEAAFKHLPGGTLTQPVAVFASGLPLVVLVPVTVVLANEWAPGRRRTAMVLTMCGGYSLGSVLSPSIASGLIHSFGWRSMFYVGGAASALLAVAVASLLPESLRFLGMRETPARKARIAQILRRFAPDAAIPDAAVWASPVQTGGWRAVPALFREHRATVTALAWICLFLIMIAETFLVSWLPTLLGDVVAADRALWLSSLFSLGGIAATFLVGGASDRFGPWRVLGSLLALGVVFMALIGLAGGVAGALIATIVLAGFCVIGAHHLMTVLAATLYPTAMRATGTSWAVAVGRVGSIVGPAIGGALIGLHWPSTVLFPAMAVFAAAAGIAALLLTRASHL